MKNNKTEKLIKEYLTTGRNISSPSMDERILSDAMQAYEKSEINSTAFLFPYGKFLKFAAAALILIAVFITMTKFKKNNDIFAEAVKKIDKAQILTYSVTTNPMIQTQWIYDNHGHIRINTADNFLSIIIDTNRGSAAGIMPKEKKYIKMKLSNIHSKAATPFLIIEKIKSLNNELYQPIGKKEIEERTFNVYKNNSDDIITTLWIDPEKIELVRIDIESVRNPSINMTAQNFKAENKSDNFVFTMKTPDNFEQMPIWLHADVSFASEKYINDFLSICHDYRDKICGTDFIKARNLSLYRQMTDLTSSANFKIVYPFN